MGASPIWWAPGVCVSLHLPHRDSFRTGTLLPSQCRAGGWGGTHASHPAVAQTPAGSQEVGAGVLRHQLKPKLRAPLEADPGATTSAPVGFLERDPFIAGRCCSGPHLPTLLALENCFLQRPGGASPAKQMVNGKISASHDHSGKNLQWRWPLRLSQGPPAGHLGCGQPEPACSQDLPEGCTSAARGCSGRGKLPASSSTPSAHESAHTSGTKRIKCHLLSQVLGEDPGPAWGTSPHSMDR